jgi:hypothetical protein
MTTEELKNIDSIVDFISSERYSIQGIADVSGVFARLTNLHEANSAGLEQTLQKFLRVPHSRTFMNELIEVRKKELKYLRTKSQQLAKELDCDDLDSVSQEVINFIGAVQNYLSAASGEFEQFDGQPGDLLEYLTEAEFLLEENYRDKYPAISMRYEFRTETGVLLKDDLGYKMYLTYEQMKEAWGEVISAYENLEFLKK